MLKDELLGCGGILIGSRGLGVETEDSDWDIAILREDLPERMRNNGVPTEKYFNLLPLGNSSLIRYWRVDILIYDDIEDLYALVCALDHTKQVPKQFLKHKHIRIAIFEQALIDTGRFRREDDSIIF